MDKGKVIEAVKEYAKNTLSGEGSGHDWWHVYRVWKNAIHIGKGESVDMFVVEVAALLHDIADYKLHDGDETIGPKTARAFLETLAVDESVITHVCDIIATASFKGAGVTFSMKTKEGEVVQDADRLDALGAIGIGRTFAFGGHKGREMYNPEIAPQMHQTFEAYKQAKGTTLNHFYEKLLLLKDLMNTATAKKIAEERHEYMKEYVERFLQEWEGIK